MVQFGCLEGKHKYVFIEKMTANSGEVSFEFFCENCLDLQLRDAKFPV